MCCHCDSNYCLRVSHNYFDKRRFRCTSDLFSLPLSLRWAAGGKEAGVLLVGGFSPVHIGELLQNVGDVGLVEEEGDEATVLVGGIAEEDGVAFQGHPLGGEGVLGHDQDERAGLLQAFRSEE